MSRQRNLFEGTEVSQCQVGETRESVVQISHPRIDRRYKEESHEG